MRSLLATFKLGSSRVVSSVLALSACIGLASTTTGCIIVNDNDSSYQSPPSNNPPPDVQPMKVAIDPDVKLTAAPGDGVGVFVEYGSGGHWHIWTTCDTSHSSSVCSFDIFASTIDGSAIDFTGQDLEGYDFTSKNTDGSVEFYAETSSDTDAVDLTTTPGATLQLEVRLDGNSAPAYVDWFGAGVLHKGAPTNPVLFVPKTP
jgi:hypothetical protein